MSANPFVIRVAATGDPDEFAQSLLPVTPLLAISPMVARFRAAATLVPLTRMGLFLPKVSLGHVQHPIVEDLYTLNIPLNEPLEVRVAGRYVTAEPGNAYLAGPDSMVDLRTSASTGTLALNIDAALVRSHWLGPENSGPSGEPCVFSLANSSGRALFQALSDAWGDSLNGPVTLAQAQELEHRITTALSHCLAPEDPSQAAKNGGKRALRRAKEYIHAALGDPITVPDIVRAAGVSHRTLYRMFLADQGVTPMQYVTAERLHAVRRQLLAVEHDDTTVTRAALSHGFAHLGRFSVLYREAFGESPSKTLRR